MLKQPYIFPLIDGQEERNEPFLATQSMAGKAAARLWVSIRTGSGMKRAVSKRPPKLKEEVVQNLVRDGK